MHTPGKQLPARLAHHSLRCVPADPRYGDPWVPTHFPADDLNLPVPLLAFQKVLEVQSKGLH